MPHALISSNKLTDLQKALVGLAGDDADKLAALNKAFTDFGEATTEVDDEVVKSITVGDGGDADGADPVQDVMLGLFNAASKISKANVGDKDQLLQKAFQDAYEAMNGLVEEASEFSYQAGLAKAKKPAAAADDPEDASDGGDDEDTEDMDKILKAAPGPVRQLVSSLMKRLDVTTAKINALQGERDMDLFKRQARDLGQPDAFADVLKNLKAADPTGKLATSVTNIVKGQAELLKQRSPFTEIGADASLGGGSTAMDQLNGYATEIQKAAGGPAKMSLAKAFVAACDQHKDVYARTRVENA